MHRARPALVVALVLVVEALLLVGPILRDGGIPIPLNYVYAHDLAYRSELAGLEADPGFLSLPVSTWTGDLATMFYPWYTRNRAAWAAGRIPLWDPMSFCGYAVHANIQLASLDPLTLATYPFSVPLGLTLRLVLRLLVAYTGAYLLARAAGSSRPAAVLAGTIFSLSGPVVGWLSYSLGGAIVWLPHILVATLRLHRRSRARDVALLATVLSASLLAGHVEASFICGVTAALLAAWLVAREPFPRCAAPRLIRLGAAVALAGLLAAVHILPFAAALGNSWLLHVRTDPRPLTERIVRAATQGGAPLSGALTTSLGTVVFPAIDGAATRLHWPPPRKSPNLVEKNAYGGLLTLALALAAIQFRRQGSVGLAVVALGFLAIGLRLPPFELANLLPVASLMPPERWRFVWILGLALLAARGLDALRAAGADEARRWRRSVLTFAALVALYVVAILVYLEVVGRRWATTTDIAHFAVSLALLALVALMFPRLVGRQGAITVVAVTLVAVDLLAHGLGVNSHVLPRLAAIQPGAARFLAAQPGWFRVGRADTSVLVANLPPLWGLADGGGYDAIYPWWVRDLWDDNAPEPLSEAHVLRGERYIVAAEGNDLAARSPHFRRAWSDGFVAVFESARALPRAVLVRHVLHLPDEGAATARAAFARTDFRTTVVTSDPALEDLGGGVTSSPSEATVVLDAPEHIAIRTRTASAAHLVLLDTYDAGWRATVDGRPTPIHRANHAFRAVTIPAGEHLVEMRFEPWTWRWGSRLSLASLCLLVALFIAGPRQSPSRQRQASV